MRAWLVVTSSIDWKDAKVCRALLACDPLTREHLSTWQRAVMDCLHGGVVSGVAEREEGER